MDFNLITIDIVELKDDVNGLQDFLTKKLAVPIKIDGKSLNVGSKEEQISNGRVKDCVERFFYRHNLSDKYKVQSQKDSLKIVKRKT